jgi:MoxR-like ATPase
MPDTPRPPLDAAHTVAMRLRERLRAAVKGRDDVIDLLLVGLLADGHVLLEDYPGSGKTTLAKALGAALEDDPDSPFAAFRRVQFTPDLLPSDITGVSVFDAATSSFQFRPGPLFAHVVLADEINRTSPKVQSAMLEAMAEKQVTVDNVTHALDELFFVIATQNPRDVAGTYPLPVPQLDRFLFKIRMEHIGRDEELEVLRTRRERRDTARADLPRVARADVLAARRAIDANVVVHDAIHECLVDVSRALRSDERVRAGNSTRSLVLAVPALQALALLHGRDFVSSEDVERLLPFVLTHRIEAALGATGADEVVKECMVAPLERLARGTLSR